MDSARLLTVTSATTLRTVPKTGHAGFRIAPPLSEIKRAMPQMLLIVEPLGQRAERGREAGEVLYQRMLDFAGELQAEGLLLGVNSLGSAARRLAKRDGQAQVWDGPFAEAKEMVGGYFLLDTEDPAVALAWAERCPAAEWATVEIRGVGPCYL
jgi:hypothetical protein